MDFVGIFFVIASVYGLFSFFFDCRRLWRKLWGK